MSEPGDIPTIVHAPEASGELVWMEDGVERPFEDVGAESHHTWLEDSFDWTDPDQDEDEGDDEGGPKDDGIVWL